MTHDKNQVSKQPTEYTALQKATEEGKKLQYDTFKHLTTLSTGSILLLVTFLEKIFKNPDWKFLVAIALLMFVVSILSSLVLMMLTAGYIMSFNIEEDLHGEKEYERAVTIGFMCSATGFVLGILAMVIFALKNLFVPASA